MVFRKKGIPTAYSWKESEAKWNYVGEVVDPNAGGGRFYEGDRIFQQGEYDHIFNVDLGDGLMKKLPFNNGANIDQAAQKFILREGLDLSNLAEIKDFITKNSASFATKDLSTSE